MRIGLFLNNLDEEYQLSVFKGIKAEATALGLELVCVQGESLPAKPAVQAENDQKPDIFPSRHLIGADGILFLSSVLFDRDKMEYGEQVKKLFDNFPFVSVGDRLFDYHSIQVSSEKPMWDLMDHLIKMHKYNKFLFIGGPSDHPDNIVRETIFKKAIERNRVSNPLLEGTVINGNFLETSGMNITRTYMKQHIQDPPDVIVAANDTMAIGARNVLLSSENLRWSKCPVTGFDDISQSGLEIPVLTTIRQPLDELGKLGVRTLLDLIRGKDDVPLTFTADAKLIIRSSCGCYVKLENKTANFVQYRTIYDLRYISALGKTLTAINTYEEMFEPLNSFLSNLNVPLFYLVVYDQSRLDIGPEGKLIYERTPDKVVYGLQDARKVIIKDLFKELSSCSLSSRMWCMKYLCSGSEYLGLVIYEGPDLIHPQLCNGLILLANTVKRLFADREKADRALQLEHDVEFRTRDLMSANKKLMEEVDRRMKVEAEVFRISEMERRRFSMDLYDEVCRRLKETAESSRNLASDRSIFKQSSSLKALSAKIEDTLLHTRRYAHTSFPAELITAGLRKSLETLCSETAKNTRCECQFGWNGGPVSELNQSQDIYTYWIIQEAIQNTVRHTKAKHISVDILMNAAEFIASVQDDGKGNPVLNTGTILTNENNREGLGLRSMRYWARQAGADFFINSRESGGTTVKICIKLKGNSP